MWGRGRSPRESPLGLLHSEYPEQHGERAPPPNWWTAFAGPPQVLASRGSHESLVKRRSMV